MSRQHQAAEQGDSENAQLADNKHESPTGMPMLGDRIMVTNEAWLAVILSGTKSMEVRRAPVQTGANLDWPRRPNLCICKHHGMQGAVGGGLRKEQSAAPTPKQNENRRQTLRPAPDRHRPANPASGVLPTAHTINLGGLQDRTRRQASSRKSCQTTPTHACPARSRDWRREQGQLHPHQHCRTRRR